MKKTRILFINSEVEPYMASRLATLGKQLPQALQDSGHEIRVFMPRFGSINERRNQLHEVIRLSGQNLVINETDHALVLKVATHASMHTQVYFIDNEDYFSSRGDIADKKGVEYQDQVERCLFFARGVAETVKKLRWSPDIIYCQGWFAAVAPMFLKKSMHDMPCFKNAKYFLALFDNAYQKEWSITTAQILKTPGVTKADISDIKDKAVSCTDLCKLATKFCDGIIVTDPGVDQEIIENAKNTGKAVLDVSEHKEVNAEIYSNFFDSFIKSGENSTEDE